MGSQSGHHGPPPPFARLTTESVATSDRLDFWRDLFVSCEITRPSANRRDTFDGELVVFKPDDGPAFARIKGDPLVCSFGRRDSGLVLLGTVGAGTLDVRSNGDQTMSLDRGSGLVLVDCDRPTVTTSTTYELAHLMLPRSLVVDALGGYDWLHDKAVVVIPDGGLARLLSAQIEAMAAHALSLDGTESVVAVRAATALAVTLLSRLGGSAKTTGEFEDQWFVAARCYIEANASRHDLTAGRIAAAVGCSRAHLYRMFADRSATVAGTLRDMRLSGARLALETSRRSIGAIAFDAGYADLSAFGKAFRRHYEMTPGDCRARALPDRMGAPRPLS